MSPTTAAKSGDYSLPANDREQTGETGPGTYEIPNSHDQKNCEHVSFLFKRCTCMYAIATGTIEIL